MLKRQSHWFQELIWSVRVDVTHATLGVQLRNGTNKWAGYCLVDIATGQTGPIFALENGWWTELLGVSDNLLYIGRYGDGALPVISETFAVDGKQALVINDIEWKADFESEAVKLPNNVARLSIDLSPLPLADSWIAELLLDRFQIRAWHVAEAAGASLRLGVWSDSDFLFQTTLEENMDKLNPSPFFVAGNWLIFIRDRMELCWIDLTEAVPQS